jgi:hypothetical protein
VKPVQVSLVAALVVASHVFNDFHDSILLSKEKEVRCDSMALFAVVCMVNKSRVSGADSSVPNSLAVPRRCMVVSRCRPNNLGISGKANDHQPLIRKLANERAELNRIKCQQSVVCHGNTAGLAFYSSKRIAIGSQPAFIAREFEDSTDMPEVLLSGIQLQLMQNPRPIIALVAGKTVTKDGSVMENIVAICHFSQFSSE